LAGPCSRAKVARPAPESAYGFPGATCSRYCRLAHGIPGDQVLKAGDLVNIDVSADIEGFLRRHRWQFRDCPVPEKIERLCRDGKRAMWAGIKAVKSGGKLNEIGRAVQTFADRNRYTLIRNLASHGVGAHCTRSPDTFPHGSSRAMRAAFRKVSFSRSNRSVDRLAPRHRRRRRLDVAGRRRSPDRAVRAHVGGDTRDGRADDGLDCRSYNGLVPGQTDELPLHVRFDNRHWRRAATPDLLRAYIENPSLCFIATSSSPISIRQLTPSEIDIDH